jgi:FkbH-like protein
MHQLSALKKMLKNAKPQSSPIKVAILGDSATQFLKISIEAFGLEEGLNLQIWEADYNQIERQILDPSSELYAFEPQYSIIYKSAHKYLQQFNKSAHKSSFAQDKINDLQMLISQLQSQSTAKILYFNAQEINDRVFGNFATQTPESFLYQIRSYNYQLMLLAQNWTNVFIIDLSSTQNQLGKSQMFAPATYTNADMLLSVEAVPYVGYEVAKVIAAIEGKIKKCLILDLDNTLWGGIIGDDGLEKIQIGQLGIGKAFTEFQLWIKKLKDRGIILAVCSKNTEHVAKEPFEKHPDMVLKLDDIAVFVANWNNKADNIRHIQQVLNIGFDAMVFLDDNPAERAIVKENLPQVTVPELPEDPAEYLEFLYQQNLFESVAFSQADKDRTKQYQVEAQRLQQQQNFTNEGDFLASLQMQAKVEDFNSFNTPRVAQLSQRSNQFNLRTQRYTDDDIAKIGQNQQQKGFAFGLGDKFGDHGLVAVIILDHQKNALFIDSWFMSCRVLKRGMEDFCINTLVDYAKTNNFGKIIGEYLETEKNQMVQNHYSQLGFKHYQGQQWILDVQNYQDKTHYIN